MLSLVGFRVRDRAAVRLCDRDEAIGAALIVGFGLRERAAVRLCDRDEASGAALIVGFRVRERAAVRLRSGARRKFKKRLGRG